MKRISTTQLRENLASILSTVTCGHQRLVLQRHGKDIAAVVPVGDFAVLEALYAHPDQAEILGRLKIGECR